MSEPEHPLALEKTAASPIERAEDWLVAECNRLLGSVFRSIESGPGEWSDAYLQRVVSSAPAVRVAFLDGDGKDTSDLQLDGRWAIYVLTGWRGTDDRTRRRGDARQIGSYRAACLLGAWLHNRRIPDVGGIRVRSMVNMWAGRLDRSALSLFGVTLDIPMTVPVPVDVAQFRSFLTAGVDWDIQGGGDVDSSQTITLPQEA